MVNLVNRTVDPRGAVVRFLTTDPQGVPTHSPEDTTETIFQTEESGRVRGRRGEVLLMPTDTGKYPYVIGINRSQPMLAVSEIDAAVDEMFAAEEETQMTEPITPEVVDEKPTEESNAPAVWGGRFPDLELDLANTLEKEFRTAQTLSGEIKDIARQKVETLTQAKHSIQAQADAAKVHLKEMGLVTGDK
jgi:hypothetical protein